MPHLRQHKIAIDDAKLSPFEQMLEQALRHYKETAWLGANSPLASPYLLHDFLGQKLQHVQARGQVLQNVLDEALDEIEDDRYQERYQKIIRGRYFEKQPEWKLLQDTILEKNAFHTSRKNAIKCLGRTLVKKLNPALRLEAPLPLPKTIYGRKQAFEDCHKMLQAGATVMLMGPGGVGKTTLASSLAQQWTPAPVFWFTIRLGLNDHWHDLVFALGYFLHRCGESALWGALVADTNLENLPRTFSAEKALEMVRFALVTLKTQEKQPLLCFDEVDLLQPAENNYHALTLEWIGTLRNLTPILLIGQHTRLDATMICKLEGLSFADAGDMLRSVGIILSPLEQQRVLDYTQGNPRLLELLHMCAKSGESIPTLLEKLADVPPFSYLLNRILYRLPENERSVVLDLAVFRNAAPRDFWDTQEAGDALDRLLKHGLVQHDGRGGVLLLPAYRDALYEMLSKDQKQELHKKAAAVRAARGAYTAAAYHTAASGYPEQAIGLWREHQHAEINQGQGAAALQFLRSLLDKPLLLRLEVRQELAIHCAELERLFSNPVQALTDIRDIVAKTPILEMRARTLEGMIANDLSDFGRAQAMHQKALTVAEKLVEARLTHIHKGLGWMHMRERNLDGAWREAQLAGYEAENFLGVMLEMRCDYTKAEERYLAALQLAQSLSNHDGIAKTCTNLASLLVRNGRFNEAERHFQAGDDSLKIMGRISELYARKINWAFLFNLSGQYEKTLPTIEEAIAYFATHHIAMTPYQTALFQQALAEAHLGLGNLAEAERSVLIVQDQEEIDILPDAYRTHGEIMLAYGRSEEAEQWIRRSLAMLSQNPDPYLEGFAWRALAQIYRARKDKPQANECKRKALALFAQINLLFEAERTDRLLPDD